MRFATPCHHSPSLQNFRAICNATSVVAFIASSTLVHGLPSMDSHPQTSIHGCSSTDFHPPTSVQHCSSPSMRCIFQIVCTTYIRIQYHILQTISNALNFYKILGHGTTPCPQMIKALSLSQSQGISYKATHNHLSQFL